MLYRQVKLGTHILTGERVAVKAGLLSERGRKAGLLVANYIKAFILPKRRDLCILRKSNDPFPDSVQKP